MNCTDVQLALGAEPGAMSAEIEGHLRTCAQCAEYQREMLRLDENIRRALLLDVAALRSDSSSRQTVQQPPELAVPPRTRSARVRQWTLAASLLLAIGVGLVMWGALPSHSLAADIVAHVISEPVSQEDISRPVASNAVAEVMRTSALRLDPIGSDIVFARTCFFRGRLVPHFIVRTERGAATVMILPHEHVEAPQHFVEGGYKGILLPDSNKGSIAVLSRADVDMEKSAREFRQALHAVPPRM